jgi:hypothetical protein
LEKSLDYLYIWLKWIQIRIQIDRPWIWMPIPILQNDAGPTGSDPDSDPDPKHWGKPANFALMRELFLTKITCRTAPKKQKSTITTFCENVTTLTLYF